LVRRDHADRFVTIVLKDGSSHTFQPCPPEKPAIRSLFDPESIGQELGLSPRQALITRLLAEGEMLGDIAKENGMTLSTTRWHLREIFKRTGCRSQAQLKDLVEKSFRQTSEG
jgi:DNA-binding NarL/FixJ family response regulator